MKYGKIALVFGLLMVSAAAFAQSTMTDQQVMEYYQQGAAEGKSQQDMTRELLLKGVSREQANRILRMARADEQNAVQGSGNDADRSHSSNDLPETALSVNPDELLPEEADAVYGRDIFRSQNLSFAPSQNMATPQNYRLGPGDEVIIDIFGSAEKTIRQTISPEGSINVEYVGPVYLNGMTIEDANSYLKKKLSSIYSGLNYEGQRGTQIRLTLGKIRSIQVNVLGDVRRPGAYRVSSFSTVMNVLYQAGGIVEPGTLRNIQVTRGGKTVGFVDVYDLLLTGDKGSDIRLEEDDVILVGPYTEMVKIEGMVKRPMFFEMKEGETIANLLAFAGGFSSGAYTGSINVVRQNGKSFEVRTVENADFTSFVLQNGDELTVNKLQSRFENRISVSGAVFFPGMYELTEEVGTVRKLIAKAGGLLPEAFLGRAVIHRELDDQSKEVYSINLGNVLSGTDPDFVFRNNDELIIASQPDIKDAGSVGIGGLVAHPGSFTYAENMTVEDLIIMAGGLKDGASMARVDVTRRRKDPNLLEADQNIGELYTFAIKDGLIEDGQRGFVLEPYDEVIVHQSPSYNTQIHFRVSGQVNFPGTYSMTSREERLSTAIQKAGGLTSVAYVKGARLFRRTTQADRRQTQDAIEMLRHSGDSTSISLVDANDSYQVAIDLEKALAKPGSMYDVVLKEGDRIEIPLMDNTVTVNGAVMLPGTLSYIPGKKANDYINRSGGFGDRARRKHAYVVSMNANKKRMRTWTKIEPGDEIVIPQKEERNIDMRSTALVFSSSASALATLSLTAISVVNQLKKN